LCGGGGGRRKEGEGGKGGNVSMTPQKLNCTATVSVSTLVPPIVDMKNR